MQNAAIIVVIPSLILKSSTILSVRKSKKALMTNLNSPKVIIRNGNVRRISNHPVKKTDNRIYNRNYNSCPIVFNINSG